MNITPEELQKLLDEAYQKGKSEGTVHIHYIPIQPVQPVQPVQQPPWITYPTVTWCGTTVSSGDKA